MNCNVIIPANGDEPHASKDETTFHFDRTFQPPYQKTKVAIECPYDLKDDLKSLDYDKTHRAWDKIADAWTADLSELNRIIRHLNDCGHDVSVDLRVAREYESYSRGGVFLPEHRDNAR